VYRRITGFDTGMTESARGTIRDFGFWILDLGFWIWDLGFGIWDLD
jgi:hypothetical protein